MYELWDVEAGNLVGEYATEAAALDVVARYVEADDVATLESLALLKRSPEGTAKRVAESSELAKRARTRGQSLRTPSLPM